MVHFIITSLVVEQNYVDELRLHKVFEAHWEAFGVIQ